MLVQFRIAPYALTTRSPTPIAAVAKSSISVGLSWVRFWSAEALR